VLTKFEVRSFHFGHSHISLPEFKYMGELAINLVFTARCYAERGYATVCRPSVCPSVYLSVTLRYRDHIGWNSSKIILRLMRGLTPTWAI